MSENINTENVDVISPEQAALYKKDRMRFSKNKLSSTLTLLAILINVFYFVSIYKSNVRYYYTAMIGVSVVYNLVFMLIAFLSSEGIKNYKLGYGITLIVVGALQLLRIVYFPVKAHSAEIVSGTDTITVMLNGQFARVLIYLIASAALLIAAGILGIIRSKTLANYRAEIGGEQPS